MAGFTIPNTPDASNQNQAEPDSLDFQILGNHKNAVVSGMDVTPGTGTSVNIAIGEILVNGIYYTYSGGTASLTTYGSLPFFDVIVARVSGSTVTCYAVPGAADTNPRFPAVGTSAGQVNLNTDVVLATVWRPDNSTPSSGYIVDKRLLVRSSATRLSSGAASGGSSGDLHVNSSWTADSGLAGPLSVKVGSTWYQLPRYSSSFSAGTITANLVGDVTGNVSGTAGSVAWSSITGKPSLVYPDSGTYSINISGNASTATDSVTANYLDGGTNVDPLGGPYIGWSNTFPGWAVEGGFRVTSSNFYATGLGTTGAASNVRVLSDGRLAISTSLRKYKEDIQDISDALSTVNSLRPRSFKMKPADSDGPVERYVHENLHIHGFIVEEVLEATPDLIDYTITDGEITPQMWRTNDLIALLTRAVQQLSARIEALEAK